MLSTDLALELLAQSQNTEDLLERILDSVVGIRHPVEFVQPPLVCVAQLPIAPGLGAPSVHGAPPNICHSLFCFRVVLL